MTALFATGFACIALAASNVVGYTYDPAGNITNIARPGSGTLAITGFTPGSGPVGTSVTIIGSGFSTTPASNLVKFNGTSATVSTSTTGSISTTVPTSATTGPISVTVGGVTVASSTSFSVTTSGAPTITSFTPTSGASSSSVAVTGTNFVSGGTTVALNGVSATASATSTTALSFTVPSAVSSGRIAATTSSGTGTSASDFIVPPPGLATSDIESSVRITADGGYQNIAVTTAGKTALVLFDAAAGPYYSLQLGTPASSPSGAYVNYKVIKPDNSVLMSGQFGLNLVPTIHLPVLSTAGTYTLQLTPTGLAVLNANVRLDTNVAIVVDGSPVSLAQDQYNQSTRFTFSATAGQRIGLGSTGMVVSPAWWGVPIAVHRPDGSGLASINCNAVNSGTPEGNCGLDMLAPVTGTYTITVDSASGVKASSTLQLTSDASATLSPDVGQAVTLTRVGQSASYTFTASAGDSFGVDISGATLTPRQVTMFLSILRPDGSTLGTSSQTPPANLYYEMGTITTAGTYTVHVRTDQGMPGTFALTLKQGPLLGTSDSPTAFALASANETARVRFAPTSGQSIGVGVSNFAYVGSAGTSSLTVYSPSASNMGSGLCNPDFNNAMCQAQVKNAVAGTYSAVIVPVTGAKMSGNIEVSADATGTLTAGTPQAITASRVGQGAVYTFAGTAGDSTSIKLFGVTTTPASQTVNFEVDRPDTSFVGGSGATTTSPGILNLSSLPVTGTYRVVATTPFGYPWSGTLELDPGALLTLNSTTATLANTAAGEPVRYRFSATSGQQLDFGLSGLAYGAGSGTTIVSVTNPGGGTYPTVSCNTTGTGGCDGSFGPLDTGTYSIIVMPPYNATLTGGTVAVSTPLTGTFVIGDPAQTVAIARGGQTARYTFSGTSGQLLRINWSSTTVSGSASVSVSVIRPDGFTLSSSSFVDSATGGFDVASLPSTGTYTIVFDPTAAATMSAPVSLVTR